MKFTARVASIHAIFQLTVCWIWMFFSLKPSPCQGESSLKISACWGSPFRRSLGTNKQSNRLTDRLTDWCFDNTHMVNVKYFRKLRYQALQEALLKKPKKRWSKSEPNLNQYLWKFEFIFYLRAFWFTCLCVKKEYLILPNNIYSYLVRYVNMKIRNLTSSLTKSKIMFTD